MRLIFRLEQSIMAEILQFRTRKPAPSPFDERITSLEFLKQFYREGDDGKAVVVGRMLLADISDMEKAKPGSPEHTRACNGSWELSKYILSLAPHSAEGLANYVLAAMYLDAELSCDMTLEKARLLLAASRVGKFHLPPGLEAQAYVEIRRVAAIRGKQDDDAE